MKPLLASWLLIVAVASCKSKETAAPKPTGSGSAVATVADAAAAPADATAGSGTGEDFAGPTEQAMKAAFGGTPPPLPLLAKDGATAAVDLSESLGLSDMTTYEVGFLGGKQQVEKVVLLDETGAQSGGDSGELPVTDALKGAATALSKRLADGGYTAFEAHVGRQPEDETAVELGGLGKLAISPPVAGKGDQVDARPLVLTLLDATGRPVSKETIKAIPAGKAESACGGEPRLADVWYDSPRKRVLARVYYLTGGDMCENVPALYRMWTLP